MIIFLQKNQYERRVIAVELEEYKYYYCFYKKILKKQLQEKWWFFNNTAVKYSTCLIYISTPSYFINVLKVIEYNNIIFETLK